MRRILKTCIAAISAVVILIFAYRSFTFEPLNNEVMGVNMNPDFMQHGMKQAQSALSDILNQKKEEVRHVEKMSKQDNVDIVSLEFNDQHSDYEKFAVLLEFSSAFILFRDIT